MSLCLYEIEKKTILIVNDLSGSGTGQLVWYEHPQTDSISNPWHHFIIADHSDTFFDITTLTTPTGTNTVIVTTGFFSNQLKIYWTTDPAGKWTDTLKVVSLFSFCLLLSLPTYTKQSEAFVMYMSFLR